MLDIRRKCLRARTKESRLLHFERSSGRPGTYQSSLLQGQCGFEKWEVEPAAMPVSSIIGKPNEMKMNSGLRSTLV